MAFALPRTPQWPPCVWQDWKRIRRVTSIEDFTQLFAEHYADIFAELSQLRLLIPQNDIAGAATARSLGFGVLIGPEDEATFRRVSDLPVVGLA